MRRGGPRPPLLCGGGSRSQRGARRGRWRRALSACRRRRGRRDGRRRAALAAPLHAAPLVCSTRLPCRRIRCGVAALGRRSSAAAARALSAVRVVVGGNARSLRAAVGEVVAFFGAAAVALLSRRRSTRRSSCALRARRAAASDAAWWRSAAAPLRRRLALSARYASWSVAAGALCVRPWTGRGVLRGGRHRAALAAPLHAAQLVCSLRPPCRRIRCGVVALGRRTSVAAARALSAVRIVVCGSARSLRAAVSKVVAFSGRPPSPCSCGAAPRGAARVLYTPAVPPHPMRRGGARPPLSAAAARALSAVRVVIGGCSRSLRAAVDEVVTSFGATTVALLSQRRSTRRLSRALRARRAAASHAAWWPSAAAPLRRRLALSARCASWSVAARAPCVRPSTRSSRSRGGRRRLALAAPLHAALLVCSTRLPCRRIRCGVVALGRRSSRRRLALSARCAS